MFDVPTPNFSLCYHERLLIYYTSKSKYARATLK